MKLPNGDVVSDPIYSPPSKAARVFMLQFNETEDLEERKKLLLLNINNDDINVRMWCRNRLQIGVMNGGDNK